MQNLSDKELDELVKKASESQSYPYEADAWSALSRKLDAQPKTGLGIWRKPVLLVSGLLLIGTSIVLSVIIFTSETALIRNSENPESTRNDQATDNSVEGSQVLPSVAFATKEQKSSSHSLMIDDTLQQNLSEISSNNKLISTDFSQVTHKQTNKTEELRHNKNENQQLTTTQSIDPNEHAQLTPEPEKNQPQTGNFSVNEEAMIKARKQLIEPVEETINVTVDSSETSITRVASTDSLFNDAEQGKTLFNRLAIKFSVSPDFSADNFSTIADPGFNYGLTVEYTMINSLSFSVGLLSSQKYYTARDVAYGRYTAEFAEGHCRMWDIPVNVHYYFPASGKLLFFGTLGVSSYLMNRENYVYYPDATDRSRKYYAEIRNENREWFKILNLSVAAQVQVNSRLYLQLEPFIKAPLAGVGEGNISLSSFGTFLSFKYQFRTNHPHEKKDRN